MLNISHRGFCREATENTLEAFTDAVRLGVDGIETDIRMSTDGRLVLFHNRRVTDGRAVRELAYAELCDTVGYRVPTLEDALQWSDQLLWVLELKDAGAVEPFVAAVKPFLSSRRLLVISFWHNVMEQMQRQLDVECAVLVAHRPADFQSSPLRRWHTIVWKYEFIDRALIQESIANGHCNMVYNVDGVDEHRSCFELGVDGIITDQPLLVAAELHARQT
jgi:glycerophosphoryl diester phosphodiesterase